MEALEKFLRKHRLENKEREVCIYLLCTDYSTREIARIFRVRDSTIRNHCHKIYNKTNSSNRYGLMIMYHQYLELKQERLERVLKSKNNKIKLIVNDNNNKVEKGKSLESKAKCYPQ